MLSGSIITLKLGSVHWLRSLVVAHAAVKPQTMRQPMRLFKPVITIPPNVLLLNVSAWFRRDFRHHLGKTGYLAKSYINKGFCTWMSLALLPALNSCVTSKTYDTCDNLLKSLKKEWALVKVQVGSDFSYQLEDGGTFYQGETNYGVIGYLISSPHLANQFALENPEYQLEDIGICWKPENSSLVWRISSYSKNP